MFARPGLRYSLTGLRALEAAARLGSLTTAARELGVSPSAVSFQLRDLQLRLGATLLQRTGHGVTVAEEGVQLAGELSAAFGAIDQALLAFERRRTEAQVVTVSTLPFFASRWLIPRLAGFHAKNPELDVRISTTERRVDLVREGFDLAIRSGEGDYEGVHVEKLMEQRLAAVCHRSYAETHAGAILAGDWSGLQIIDNASRQDAWLEWARGSGVGPGQMRLGRSFDTSEHVLHAILEGLGVGLFDISLLQRELRHGELVQVHSFIMATGWSHFLLTPGRGGSGAAERFRAWISQEARGESSALT